MKKLIRSTTQQYCELHVSLSSFEILWLLQV